MILQVLVKHQRKAALLLGMTMYGELLAYAHAYTPVYAAAEPVSNGYYIPAVPFPQPAIVIPPIEQKQAAILKEAVPVPVLPTDAVTVAAGNPAASPTVIERAVNEKEKTPDIGGPGQPEMSTFKSVGADNMVNLFTGDFSYNIPLLDVDGYPVNIFYSAGGSMDQEASWVGYGWNINPGTISRTMRGLPDDYNGDDVVTKVQSMKPDLTVGVTGSTGKETAGTPSTPATGLKLNAGIFYNNRRGVGLEAGAGFDYSPLKKISVLCQDPKTKLDTTVSKLSVSGGINLNSQNGMSLNVGLSIYNWDQEEQINKGLGASVGFNSRQGVTDLSLSGESRSYAAYCNGVKEVIGVSSSNTPTGSISFGRPSFTPSIRMPLTTVNYFFTAKLGKEKAPALFKNGTISGYLNETRIDKKDQVQAKAAYGYMYYEKANENPDALLDFNRLQDGVYTYKTPVISIPVYTYDVFSISGEGTGGSFRGYRNNPGYVRDNYTKTRTSSRTVSVELGKGNLFHGGTMLNGVFASAEAGDWYSGNSMRHKAAFGKSQGADQAFYFRNPGEQSIIDENYYNKVGGDQLIRPYLGDIQAANATLLSGYQVFDANLKVERTVALDADSYRKTRDKRTQVISYFTAEEADRVGLDRYIYSYTENVFQPGSCANSSVRTSIKRYNDRSNQSFYRKANHLSEINVLEADGRRYVYGIPVYQVKQREVTFSIDAGQGNNITRLTSYTAQQNSTSNTSGRDGLYQSEETNGYAHSFLLTGILSPDYVDVTGDGITEDDKGTAIRFNYSRVNRQSIGNISYWNTYKWRMPVAANTANYNEGLKADSRDDKGLYTYGEKELWYMHSIESKNMVATFYLSDRNDGKAVLDEQGGRAVGPGQKKLDKINLYTKADYLLYGANAKPIKTVHFEYDYSTCPDYPLNDGAIVTQGGTNINAAKGKLTLKSIWFSYNGNTNQKKNRYVFKYGSVVNSININPGYDAASYDRWGNYKPHSANPDNGVSNTDYPYTVQDAAKSNAYAAAWSLEKILLPGGAVMDVQYEADDYGFVQNKRASQMSSIAGFGASAAAVPSDKLYAWNPVQAATPGKMDYRFVFFDVASPIADKAEIGRKYLQDFKQLLLKIWVKMPKGNIGQEPAFEPLVVYGMIKDYGFAITNGVVNHNRFYVELHETENGGSPIMQTAIQFLKKNLPQRAYPGYEVRDGNALVQVVRAVFGMMNSLTQGVMGFEKNMKVMDKCREVKLAMSFARLNNPAYKKIGGGHRVKKIVINDNWNRMTGQYDSYYGQEYAYTKEEEINGIKTIISSGVASYEPGIGNEENPFREALAYSEKQFTAPTDHNTIEFPIAEMFFPSPMVGYARVSVKSIHNKDNKNIKSGIGLQQTEFYTTRDFPIHSDYTSFDKDSRHQHRPGVIQKVFNFDKREFLTLTQGVRVVLNDMNGKMKTQSSFAENDYATPINFTGYYYRLKQAGNNTYSLDNKVPVIGGPDGKITEQLIGRDVEVMNDFREHISYTRAINIPLNVDIFKAGNIPLFLPSIFRMIFRDKTMYRSATTLKVVNQYGIVDSVVNIDKGSVVGTRNMVYDAETGGVLVTRTYNEFKRPVYQFNYPAWWAYQGMGPAYKNVDAVYEHVFFRNGRIENSPQVNMDLFESGDEIYVVDKSRQGVTESAACIGLGYPSLLPQSAEYRIWALDVRKDIRNTTKEFLFIDRYGNPYHAGDATIRIIRSGKRNMTGVSAGSIVSANNPVRTVNNVQQVVIDNNTDVLQAGAAEFKEKWRVNDMFYTKDSVVAVVRQAPILDSVLRPVDVVAAMWYQFRDGSEPSGDWAFSTSSNTKINFHKGRWQNTNNNLVYDNENVWLKFNPPASLAGSTVTKANIRLYADKVGHSNGLPVTNSYKNDHLQGVPHFRGRDEGSGNNKPHYLFQISRMATPWYAASNEQGWRSNFYVVIGNQNHKVIAGQESQSVVPGNPFSKDFNVNVKGLVQGMFDNLSVSGQVPGIKFNFLTNAWDIDAHKPKGSWKPWWHYCFEPNATTNNPGISIDYSYYKCNTTDPIVYAGNINGAPTTPPPGYAYCTTQEKYTFCLSVFSKTKMNPYVSGLLGNWRGWRSHVYYGERRESNPDVATDIRKDGVIKDFETYWTFDNTNTLLGQSGSSKWVWNSEITQYNRKGAELENHDPLGRYNAGIYGYQESMPVAVINNSRLRLAAYDGFEDYYYKDDPCEPLCKPSKRHFPTGITTSMLDAQQSHSGKYSLRVNAGSSYSIDMKVSADDTEINPDVRIKVDKLPYTTTTVTPRGIGLKGHYYNSYSFGGSPIIRTDAYVNLSFRGRANGQGCRESGNLPPGVRCNDMTVRWKGKIQVITSGYYSFNYSTVDNDGWVYVNGTLVLQHGSGIGFFNQPVYLTAGTLHTIQVDFRQNTGNGLINLLWMKPGETRYGTINPMHFYPEGQEALANGTVVNETIYCEKPDIINGINHHLIDSFNLIKEKQMIASIWIKKGTQDCKCSRYNGIDIKVKTAAGTVVAAFQPKETVIEGWQQFEAVFTVPDGTDKLKLELNAPADAVLFADDLRIHPYHANMKSFVYDPVTLRLAAELDENNYAAFYEYDDDGTLVRVKKETKQGVKTITETRSATQKTITNF